MLKCRESWRFFSSLGTALSIASGKKLWEPATRATVLGSSLNPDHRIRTAFLCRRHFRVFAKSARTKRLVPKKDENFMNRLDVCCVFYQESVEGLRYLYTQYHYLVLRSTTHSPYSVNRSYVRVRGASTTSKYHTRYMYERCHQRHYLQRWYVVLFYQAPFWRQPVGTSYLLEHY